MLLVRQHFYRYQKLFISILATFRLCHSPQFNSFWLHVISKILQIYMSNEKQQANKASETAKKDNNGHQSPSHSHSHSASRSNSSSNSPSERDSGSKGKQQAEMVGDGDDKKLVRYKYCCKVCKHPDKSKRACVCVVPLSQRRAELGTGCRNCGCTGCSKEDFLSKGQDPEYHPQENDKSIKIRRPPEPAKREEKRPQRKRERSNSRKKNKSPPRRKTSRNSSSRSRSPEYIDSASMKFYNFDRSLIGGMIINEYQLNPCLLGFGVPQRTYSYLFGRPK